MRPAAFIMACGALMIAAILLSFFHPWGDLRGGRAASEDLLAGSQLSPAARRVLVMKCLDCHSERTRWPAYSHLAPVSWLVERDVHLGRDSLNLSRWAELSASDQADLMGRIAAGVRSGEMPPRQYVFIHRDARLSAEDRKALYAGAKAERRRLLKKQPIRNQPLEAQSRRSNSQ